jgi:hypothetical protein
LYQDEFEERLIVRKNFPRFKFMSDEFAVPTKGARKNKNPDSSFVLREPERVAPLTPEQLAGEGYASVASWL